MEKWEKVKNHLMREICPLRIQYSYLTKKIGRKSYEKNSNFLEPSAREIHLVRTKDLLYYVHTY